MADTLTRKTLKGTWGTLLLPILPDERIDVAALTDELEVLIQSGLDGLYTNGSAGEFYSQTEVEFDQPSELVATRCRAAGVPFQPGVCHPSPVLSLERLRRSRSLESDAFQVILPGFFFTQSTPHGNER